MEKIKRIIYSIVILSGFIFISCKVTDPNPPEATSKKVLLSVKNITCTDASLNVKTENTSTPYNLTLTINNNKKEFKCFTNDTLIYIDSLLPHSQYSINADVNSETNAVVTISTLDTTSHDFNITTFEFGDNSRSHIYDAAVLAENDIWIVGIIYSNEDCYNAAHWDGTSWELKKISYQGNTNPLSAILAFGPNDIWFSASCHYNGQTFTWYPTPVVLMGFKINKLWGTNSQNLYAVGDSGRIAHYDGFEWQKIESGTDMRLVDINGNTDGSMIWICGAEELIHNSIFLLLKNNVVQTIFKDCTINNRLIGQFTSVCGSKDEYVYLCTTYYIIKVEKNGNTEPKVTYMLPGGKSMNATGFNDIIIGGYTNNAVHFNGVTCKSIPLPLYNDLEIERVEIKNNTIVLVGNTDPYASITKGIVHLIKHIN